MGASSLGDAAVQEGGQLVAHEGGKASGLVGPVEKGGKVGADDAVQGRELGAAWLVGLGGGDGAGAGHGDQGCRDGARGLGWCKWWRSGGWRVADVEVGAGGPPADGGRVVAAVARPLMPEPMTMVSKLPSARSLEPGRAGRRGDLVSS